MTSVKDASYNKTDRKEFTNFDSVRLHIYSESLVKCGYFIFQLQDKKQSIQHWQIPRIWVTLVYSMARRGEAFLPSTPFLVGACFWCQFVVHLLASFHIVRHPVCKALNPFGCSWWAFVQLAWSRAICAGHPAQYPVLLFWFWVLPGRWSTKSPRSFPTSLVRL